ncbi:Uncharacterized protein conserved in bacteria [Actinobacillus equuli]|nr:Uncharacterized protein conserved in bacteria [Actinobacillus equuli]
MGVWVAENVLPEINLASATAINGTPFPKHDEWGFRYRYLTAHYKH